MRSTRHVVAALSLALAWPLFGEVQVISEAERTAVQIAADYLSRGPSAVAEQLAATSPLRELAPGDQLADLEVRLGPHRRAEWQLQTAGAEAKDRMAIFSVAYPAGFEDHITFDLVREGNVYKVQDVRFLALATGNKPAVETAPVGPVVPQRKPFPIVPAAAGLVVLLLLIAIAVQAQREKPLRALGIATAVVVIAATAFIFKDAILRRPSANTAAIVPEKPKGPTTLAPLLELRRALCEGTGNVTTAYRLVDRAAGRGAIADLWKIQSDLLQIDTATAKATLAHFRAPTDRPLAELLRARLALLENNDVGAVIAFESALKLSSGGDALQLESAQILEGLGFEDRARGYYDKVIALGSRDADIYYTRAAEAAEGSRDDEAEKHLRQAWTMRPVERAQLMGAGEFWSLVRRPAVTELIGFSAPSERIVVSPVLSTRAIRLPADAEARTSGEYLQVTIGEQELRVPGGAALAPVGAATVEATAWAQAERKRRLDDLSSLLTIGSNAAAYAQPALRERISGTAMVLATNNRWSDLVQLTEGLSPSSDHVPPTIFFLRSVALQHMKRTSEAQQLLAQVATSRVLQRRRDATELMQLAELLAGHDLYDAAVKMYDRSLNIHPNPNVDDRVRQIQMNKRLATKYSTHRTTHFEIHFPDDVSVAAAARLGEVFEAEFVRLQAWIPAADMPVMVVNVVWWQEFRSTYTGSDFILAFYNGKITVPFAGVGALVPELVAILAHELAHAMIAHATNDQAPRWFQEGYAQRVQGSRYSPNAFNMYDDAKLLPLALVDPVLSGSPDPEMVSAAYIVAQTNIRFLEAKYGKNGLRKIMAAFHDGATSEEALRAVSGQSMAEYEQDLRQWGRSDSHVFEN
jgi:tetratricopeptide (TPR) repeat protein